ncbi:MAG TPA: serpin family protein [Bacillota bacterium]|nr:serpin family protein [Bacillota bacterium]
MMRLLIFSMICIVYTSCGANHNAENHPVNSDVDFEKNDYEKITHSNNTLGFDMLQHVEPNESDNLFISPTSLYMAMLMIYNGADGETKNEIETVLNLEDISRDEANKANASLLSMLDKNTDHIQLDLAQSIWVNNDFTLQGDYQTVNKDYLHADVHSMDTSEEASVDKINEWVKTATHDKITDIIEPPLHKDTVALLLNAIYFNGDWTFPFDPEKTEDETFYLENGTQTNVKMMALHGDELAYMENNMFQAVSLPYGDGQMSMKIFLPKVDNGLTTFTKELTSDNWQRWQDEFTEQEGTVHLPKFEIDYETSLNQTMIDLGIQTAFTEDAEFPYMIQEDDPINISEIKQKTYINIDETGTEAAGATSAEMQTTSAPINEPFSITINKPFFITITDDDTDTILFMGAIKKPCE